MMYISWASSEQEVEITLYEINFPFSLSVHWLSLKSTYYRIFIYFLTTAYIMNKFEKSKFVYILNLTNLSQVAKLNSVFIFGFA